MRRFAVLLTVMLVWGTVYYWNPQTGQGGYITYPGGVDGGMIIDNRPGCCDDSTWQAERYREQQVEKQHRQMQRTHERLLHTLDRDRGLGDIVEDLLDDE